MNRRRFLGLIPAAGVALAAPNTIAEHDPKNIKICHRSMPGRLAMMTFSS